MDNETLLNILRVRDGETSWTRKIRIEESLDTGDLPALPDWADEWIRLDALLSGTGDKRIKYYRDAAASRARVEAEALA